MQQAAQKMPSHPANASETAARVAACTAMDHHILLADDDPHIRDVIRFAAEDAGYGVTEVGDGASALDALTTRSFDLLILDVGMPHLDGFAVCRKVRETNDVPILFLTARDEEVDRILGFEFGADDYVTKPFSPRELMLRVRAVLGRSTGPQKPAQHQSHNDLSLDADAHTARFAGTDMELTALEFSLVLALIQNPAHVLSRQQLIDQMYGNNTYLSGRTVDSHVRNIRRKGKDAGCEDLIETVHGVGFRLGPCRG